MTVMTFIKGPGKNILTDEDDPTAMLICVEPLIPDTVRLPENLGHQVEMVIDWEYGECPISNCRARTLILTLQSVRVAECIACNQFYWLKLKTG